MPDNYGAWEAKTRREERWRSRRPRCGCCGEPIEDERAYRIDGRLICRDCLEANYGEDIHEYF